MSTQTYTLLNDGVEGDGFDDPSPVSDVMLAGDGLTIERLEGGGYISAYRWHSLIFLRTWEEGRAEKMLADISHQMELRLKYELRGNGR